MQLGREEACQGPVHLEMLNSGCERSVQMLPGKESGAENVTYRI